MAYTGIDEPDIGGASKKVLTDVIVLGGVTYHIEPLKLAFGAENAFVAVDADNPLPVDVVGVTDVNIASQGSAVSVSVAGGATPTVTRIPVTTTEGEIIAAGVRKGGIIYNDGNAIVYVLLANNGVTPTALTHKSFAMKPGGIELLDPRYEGAYRAKGSITDGSLDISVY